MATAHTFDLAAIGDGLPVASAEQDLRTAATRGAMLVTAPPGTGKTTFVPPLVANLASGRVLLTQPRRVAVRAAARRLAALDGSRLGGPVGYTVRGDRSVGRDTILEVLTPGVLLRRLLTDPALDGIGAVVLDEVHERSLDGDLLLGMLADVRTLRPDLQLVAMSATLDAERFARLIGAPGAPAPVVDVPSALHPLTTRYAPSPSPRLDARGVTREFLDHLARVSADAHRETASDALVFVPGAREVDETVRRLRDLLGTTVEVLPLHGRLPAREQDRATGGRAADEKSRIVVTTAIAESSLTVPGVHLVIDAGLSREVRRDRIRDMTGLVTVSASRAAAEQRAGRAARLGPGTVVGAFAEADLARMPAASPPEITAADLTDAALLLAVWGTPRGDGLALPDPPPQREILAAEGSLRLLGLIDEEGRATAAGRRIAALPVGVREARALLAGAAELGSARAAAEVVAAISDDHRAPGADVDALLRELRSGLAPGSSRWARETQRLTRIAESSAAEGGQDPRPADAARADVGPDARGRLAGAGPVLALARPDRIARRTGAGSRSYLLASGTRAAVPEGSGLLGHAWIAVREVQRSAGRAADGTGAVIRSAAALEEADALRIAERLLVTSRAAHIEETKVRVREERRLGSIVLASTPASARPEDVASAFATELREHGLDALTWTDRARSLRDRLALLHRLLGDPWPDVSDAALLERLEDWLGPDLASLSTRSRPGSIDVTTALRRLLPWPEASRLDHLVPERLPVPSGATARIDYEPVGVEATGENPVAAVKLQELFGLARTPRLVDDRVKVLFHLLSPAGRPLAVTADLSSFWDGPYQDVRREMRGRYPKHPWPEDPWTAPATARVKRRMP